MPRQGHNSLSLESGRRLGLPDDPGNVVLEAAGHGQDQDLWDLVGMEFAEPLQQGLGPVSSRLYNQLAFLLLLDTSVPAIDGINVGKNAHTCSQVFVYQPGGELPGFLKGINSRQDNSQLGHAKLLSIMGISRKAKKDFLLGIVILTVLGFSFFMILGHGGYMKLRETREELSRLQEENLRLRQTQTAMLERINRLKTDPHEIERVAREHYQLAKPGDIIVNTPK